MNRKVITINKKLRYPAKLKSGVAEQYLKVSLVVISPKKTNNMVQSSLHEQNGVDDVSEEAIPVTTPLKSLMSIDRTNLSSFEVGSIVCMEGCSTPGLRSTHIV